MASPFFLLQNPNPFSVESLRDDGVFLGVLPDDQELRRNIDGNSTRSKRIGETTRFDVSVEGSEEEEPACAIVPYATGDRGMSSREYISPEFVVLYLRPVDSTLTVDKWHLQAEGAQDGDGPEVSQAVEDMQVSVGELTEEDMERSGHWSIWVALKYHDFDGLNSDFHMWSRLRAMIAHFQMCREHRDNEGDQAGPDIGVPLDDTRVEGVARAVRQRRA